METAIVQSISKAEYLHDVECLRNAKEMLYKAALRVEVVKAHKTSANFLFASSAELDRDIERLEKVYKRINEYCKRKAIKILAATND